MFVYQPGTSPLHRSDAVSKVVWVLAVTVTAVLVSRLWASAALLASVLLVAFALGRLTPASLLRRMWPFLIIGTWMFLFFSLVRGADGPPVASLGPLNVSAESLDLGAALGLRLVTLGTASAVFVLTTEPRRLVTDLVVHGRLPYRAGFAVYAALRFLPQLQSEARTIRHAHALRADTSGGLLSRLGEVRRLTIPLLAGALRRVQTTAVAMDSRGFGAHRTRTVLDVQPRHPAGIVLAVLQLAVCVAAAVLAIAGGGGVIAPVGG